MTDSPWLWLLSGPNGAGKSTYAPNLSSMVEEIVSPDEFALEISPDTPERAALKSGRLAIQRIRSLLQERRSFAIETTLSGHLHMELATRARATGWRVSVIYIGLRSPTLAVERVRLRHLSGGHDVPTADIRRRYSRSLKNLVEIYRIANRMLVFDNSSARRSMKRILEANEGRIVFIARRLPKWLRESLSTALSRQRI
jgi:predicted ABC-type ATPase